MNKLATSSVVDPLNLDHCRAQREREIGKEEATRGAQVSLLTTERAAAQSTAVRRPDRTSFLLLLLLLFYSFQSVRTPFLYPKCLSLSFIENC